MAMLAINYKTSPTNKKAKVLHADIVKQSKPKLNVDIRQVPTKERYTDVVTLSNNEDMKADAYKKISYSLMDVLLKNNE